MAADVVDVVPGGGSLLLGEFLREAGIVSEFAAEVFARTIAPWSQSADSTIDERMAANRARSASRSKLSVLMWETSAVRLPSFTPRLILRSEAPTRRTSFVPRLRSISSLSDEAPATRKFPRRCFTARSAPTGCPNKKRSASISVTDADRSGDGRQAACIGKGVS